MLFVPRTVAPQAANGLEDPLAESDGAYSTISAALAVAPSGASVIVRAGTYSERLTLTRSVRPDPDPNPNPNPSRVLTVP